MQLLSSFVILPSFLPMIIVEQNIALICNDYQLAIIYFIYVIIFVV